MKIEVEVSEKNESTRSPYWMIIDPNLSNGGFSELREDEKVNMIANMIDGPFFSREAAENALAASRYNFGEHATVWCCCGSRGSQYRDKVQF